MKGDCGRIPAEQIMKNVRKVKSKNEISLASFVDPYKRYGIIAVPGAIRFKEYEKGDKAHWVRGFEQPTQVYLSSEIMSISGFYEGMEVNVAIDDNCCIVYSDDYEGDGTEFDDVLAYEYVFKKEEPDFLKTAREKVITDEDIYHLGTDNMVDIEPLINQVGLRKNDKLVVSIFCEDNRYWMEVRKATAADSELPRLSPTKYIHNYFKYTDMSGISFRSCLHSSKLKIPKAFQYTCKGTAYPVWIDESRNVIIVETPPTTCGICGKIIRSTLPHEKIHTCKHCTSELGNGKRIHTLCDAIEALENFD